MDPINVLVLINLVVSMSANWGGARKGFKTSITQVVDKPKSYLQKVPPNLSALILLLVIVSIFGGGTLSAEIQNQYSIVRLVGLVLFILFSWLQVWSYRALGNYYSQDLVIIKGHELHMKGPYKYIRHPQYASQILCDLGAGLALMSYLVVPLVLILELPLFIMRASLEEKMLSEYFQEDYTNYKSKSGFMLPFIG